MDFKTVLYLNSSQLTENEKDEICQTVVKEDLDKLTDTQDLKNALILLQSLLSFKVEQVTSLGLELDELASKQGEEEAHLIQEIQDLRAQLSKGSKEYIPNGADNEDELRQLLRASELNAQKLLTEVQAQEEEHLSNKMEIEKLESQLTVLENDRLQLKRELSALQEEIHDQHKEVESETHEPQKKNRQLVEALRQKNKHLSLLLNDVEASEKENITLKEKLTSVKIELAEATKNIIHTTGELVALQITKEEQTEKVQYLEQMCEALRHQVRELVNEKEQRNTELESFQAEIDIRVQEWKEVVAMKEKQLNDLKEKLAHHNLKGQYIMKNCESEQIALLSQTLQKRESQIDELQLQLSQATKDLNDTTSFLETMHKASELSQVGPCLQDAEVTLKQLSSAEDRIKLLEEKLKDAESDADGKSEEITKLIIQLRSYEAGEFGLIEALAQIKELSQQRLVRDKHIEQLVETANQLRNTCDSLQEENLTLREQLNISPEEYIQTSATVLKTKEDNLFKVKQQQIDRLEEDLIIARMDKRKLTQQVLSLSKQLQQFETHSQEVQKPNSKQQNRSHADARAAARKIRVLQQEQQQLNIERQTLIEENEALRQGLHDILDSVHSQDGKSSVRLESEVLEHLLHALDSRHISGWYHPAMRIQAKVNTVQGNNEALREQLHCIREQESRTQNELQKAKLRIAELEGSIRESSVASQSEMPREVDYTKNTFDGTFSSHNLTDELSSQGLDVISKLNKHLLQVLHENQIEKAQVTETLNIQRELHQQMDALVLQLSQTVQQQNLEKEKWQEEKCKLEEEIDKMQASGAASQAQVAELKSMWDKFSAEDETNKEITRDIFNFATVSAEKQRLERLAIAAQNRSNDAKMQLQSIKSEWNANKQWLMKQFGDLLQFKRTSLLRQSDLELMLANSIPRTTLMAAKKQTDELTAKYNELLRQHEITVNVSDRDMKKLMSELKLEREMKLALTRKLDEMSKKIWERNAGSGMTEKELSTQLAQAEGETLREKQRASHAEKMCEIIKAEVKQVSNRCLALEEEVTVLLHANQQLKGELSSLREFSTHVTPSVESNDLESQLAAAKAEVLELQTSQKHLQELSDISQAQVQMLDQLHERSELQLDSLRQVLYKLQSETDITSEIVQLSEKLCASQISEMAAWNHTSILEKQYNELGTLCEKQAKDIIEFQDKINAEKKKYHEQYWKIQEEALMSRGYPECTLPFSFFHLVVTEFTQSSSECRVLWHLLQEAKEQVASQISSVEENKISCQQTLELQNALQANHSDPDCQCRMESWAAELTELKIKYLKCSRRCKDMESSMKQTLERLESQERLVSSLEQQLLSLDAQRFYSSAVKERGVYYDNTHQIILPEKLEEALPSGEIQPSSKDVPLTPLPPQDLKGESNTKTAELPAKQSCKEKEDSIDFALKEQITALREEIVTLNEHLRNKERELETCKDICNDLKQSLFEKDCVRAAEDLQVTTKTLDPVFSGTDEQNSVDHDRAALQATVDSLQNIIIQKEDTISRYQKFLQDVREEDGRIISALQEHLQIQQADLTAQEQAFVRLKISMRHLSLETSGESNSKASLDMQLIRSNELEDEVTLLNTKVTALSSDLQRIQQEAAYWRSIAQQHLSAIDELNVRLTQQKDSDKRPLLSLPYHETSVPSKGSKAEQEKQENYKGYKDIEEVLKRKANQVQIQLSAEITELRSKIHEMEEQENQHKNEIQRLRAQIPIYSRRLQQSQMEPILPEREAALLKRVKHLEQQLELQKAEHEKALVQRSQQESKKIKSVENVTRWDERKKYQQQIERLKMSLQEQTDETALLHDKVERMHNTIHRLEREKIALEHRIRNLNHLGQDKAILEERVKNLESNDVAQCVLDELQKDRDALQAEVQMLRVKESQEQKVVLKRMLDELKQERDKLYAEVKTFRAKETLAHEGQKVDFCGNAAQKERADFLKANLELECENLELKLELEKLRSEAPCLRHKVTHLERLLHETQEARATQPRGESIPESIITENKNLQRMVEHLSDQLENANQHLKVSDYSKVSALQTELNQKSSLLAKVKTLLERAAMKERQLSEQVLKLEAQISKR